MTITDADRDKAYDVAYDAGVEDPFGDLKNAIAQALADERDTAYRDGYLTGYGDRDENRDSKYGGF